MLVILKLSAKRIERKKRKKIENNFADQGQWIDFKIYMSWDVGYWVKRIIEWLQLYCYNINLIGQYVSNLENIFYPYALKLSNSKPHVPKYS